LIATPEQYDKHVELFIKFKSSTPEEQQKIIDELNPPILNNPEREAKRQKFVYGLIEPLKFEGSYFDD
jgi:hypothetical protein